MTMKSNIDHQKRHNITEPKIRKYVKNREYVSKHKYAR